MSAGFTTSIARFPEENVGFIFLGNDGEFRNYYLARKIYEIYLEEQLTPISKVFEGIQTASPSKEELKKNQVHLKNLNLADYEGSYFSQQINATYTFQVIQDTLFALSAAYQPIPIVAGRKDSLKTDEDFMETIIFKRDYNGKVSDCTIYNDTDDHSIAFTRIPNIKKWKKASHWKSNIFQQRMRDTLEEIAATKTLAGFAVSIFDESETFFQEGYGYATIANKKAQSDLGGESKTSYSKLQKITQRPNNLIES